MEPAVPRSMVSCSPNLWHGRRLGHAGPDGRESPLRWNRSGCYRPSRWFAYGRSNVQPREGSTPLTAFFGRDGGSDDENDQVWVLSTNRRHRRSNAVRSHSRQHTNRLRLVRFRGWLASHPRWWPLEPSQTARPARASVRPFSHLRSRRLEQGGQQCSLLLIVHKVRRSSSNRSSTTSRLCRRSRTINASTPSSNAPPRLTTLLDDPKAPPSKTDSTSNHVCA